MTNEPENSDNLNLDDFNLDDFQLDDITPSENVELQDLSHISALDLDIFVPATITEIVQAINYQQFFAKVGELEAYEDNGLYWVREKLASTEDENGKEQNNYAQEVLILEDFNYNFFYFEMGEKNEEKGYRRCEMRFYRNYHEEGHLFLYSVTQIIEDEYPRFYAGFGYQNENYLMTLPENKFPKNLGAYHFYKNTLFSLNAEKCNLIMPHIEFILHENRNFKLFHKLSEKYSEYLAENDGVQSAEIIDAESLFRYITNGYFLAKYNVETQRYDYEYCKI